jgi:hypothetical protein
VPGPFDVPKSPWDFAHTCSRFQSLAPPPFVDLLCDRPEYTRMTLAGLAGSSSASFNAPHTWSYESTVWDRTIACSAARNWAPVLPSAGA